MLFVLVMELFSNQPTIRLFTMRYNHISFIVWFYLILWRQLMQCYCLFHVKQMSLVTKKERNSRISWWISNQKFGSC